MYVYGADFWEFYNGQTAKVQAKIDWVIDLVRTLPMIPERFFKHLEGTDGLFEIRIKVGSDIFRVFCFFDKGKLVIVLNGFQKKSQKTPKIEIERAERLMRKYYDEQKR
ncbi:MAG: type II toxin-antitoxin system RelE/ParE family toxin [Imperialibacter sp.]|uniref:type II toxin-antitoxin system RelE/ParE family toxin n=1 Tax=Imperialibacter sp. TaxID=2038411 RepID=UPI003A8667F2